MKRKETKMGSREDFMRKFSQGVSGKSDADLNDDAQDYARKHGKKKKKEKKKSYFSGLKKLFKRD